MSNPEHKQTKTPVQYLEVKEGYEGQRIDNFLVARLKKVPKAHIYRILRKGEVRVNKKRVDPSYKIEVGDLIRLPPLALGETAERVPPSDNTKLLLTDRILYEDKYLLIINKPSGLAVHGGTNVRLGVVEILRHAYPKLPHLELAHRLDSDTSGCLILVKKRSILREVHELFREGKVDKIYWALTKGKWKQSELRVEAPLQRYLKQGGERMVKVQSDGKEALTVFRPLETFVDASLMEAKLYTGRTHQIRVHSQFTGHPIALDDRYGTKEFNALMHDRGLKRMFLHAKTIEFEIPSLKQKVQVTAPLDEELEKCLATMRALSKNTKP